MTPADLRAACRLNGMTGNDMAAALGVSKRTWRRWLAGQDVPHWVPLMVAALNEATHSPKQPAAPRTPE